MLKSEWHALWQHKSLILVLLMIALIPAIYCYLYLSSMWNTYGHTDDIPVAIVDHDRPATIHGKTIAIGRQLTHNLIRSDSLDFHHLSATTAERQLKSGKVYLVVTVPRDFSQDATTLLTTHPQQMQLHYTQNSGQNFIVSKITSGMATSITTKVSREVTQLNVQALLTAVHGASAGMAAAAKGTTALSAGSQQLGLGTQRLLTATTPIHNQALTMGLTASQQGIQRLQQGSVTMGQALTNGHQQLATIADTTATAMALAQPVAVQSHDISKVPNNGTGMAPFAIAIGLYVGGIALGTMYDGAMFYRKPRLALTWWGSKASVVGVVALIQSGLLFFTLRQANGLTVRSESALFWAILLGSVLFLSLIFCLRLLLGGFGTWLISIVLVLQLASSGGLYPTPLVSSFAQRLNPWLPMTYLIDLLRSAISTNTGTNTAWGILLTMIVGFNLLIVLKFHLLMKQDPLAES
ncbi:YhgE/Pip family protein [Levilactobacillus lindianensis]|uniref:YhgE/Pip family protein n=1 Tax=Levilactobacillus lindianensis TaxID=2486018 RepID=UPI000F74C01E|nr:YhgE/Pip family protein [Levilactobacillus lindianensis]